MSETAKRGTDYPTGRADGMSFTANRWVFTGPQGWRVVPSEKGDGLFNVHSYAGGATGHVAGPEGLSLSEDDAHAMAARLATPKR